MSYLEDEFALWLKDRPDIPKAVRQYKFHPKRRFLMDFAWIDHMVCVEVEGISPRNNTRHQRFIGFIKDCEKHMLAQDMGWTVFRVPGPWVATMKETKKDGKYIEQIRDERVMSTLHALLYDFL